MVNPKPKGSKMIFENNTIDLTDSPDRSAFEIYIGKNIFKRHKKPKIKLEQCMDCEGEFPATEIYEGICVQCFIEEHNMRRAERKEQWKEARAEMLRKEERQRNLDALIDKIPALIRLLEEKG